MNESILTTIKKMIGIDENDTDFDLDIIMFINMALFKLHQLGVGPEDGFAIMSSAETWNDFISSKALLMSVPIYIQIQVKMLFDQSAMTGVMRDICQEELNNLEWRIREQAEYEKSTASKSEENSVDADDYNDYDDYDDYDDGDG